MGRENEAAAGASCPLTVIKLGGSLFDLPDLEGRVRWLLRNLAPGAVWIVPGGGPFADAVRQLDARRRMPSEVSHRLALRGMSLAAEFLAATLSDATLHPRLPDAERSRGTGRPAILDVAEMPELNALPASWDVTSDSIAARIAALSDAAELVLAKSVDLPTPAPDYEEACRQGLVDRAFPSVIGSGQRVRWANLRSTPCQAALWRE